MGLACLFRAIAEGRRGLQVVFPVHPRTAKALRDLKEVLESFRVDDPQPYLEFNLIVTYAKAVITDLGDVTEETTVMGAHCLTLRDNTERPEKVTAGANELIGTNPEVHAPLLDKLFVGQWEKSGIPEKWYGNTFERIVQLFEQLL